MPILVIKTGHTRRVPSAMPVIDGDHTAAVVACLIHLVLHQFTNWVVEIGVSTVDPLIYTVGLYEHVMSASRHGAVRAPELLFFLAIGTLFDQQRHYRAVIDHERNSSG